jgi:hypothetical protein
MSGDFLEKLNLMVRTLSIFEIPQNFTQLVIRYISVINYTSDDNSIIGCGVETIDYQIVKL